MTGENTEACTKCGGLGYVVCRVCDRDVDCHMYYRRVNRIDAGLRLLIISAMRSKYSPELAP